MTKEQILKRKRAVAAAIGSVRAEGLEPSQKAMERLERFAKGEITADELRQQTLESVKNKA